jgi:hypothetical protein
MKNDINDFLFLFSFFLKLNKNNCGDYNNKNNNNNNADNINFDSDNNINNIDNNNNSIYYNNNSIIKENSIKKTRKYFSISGKLLTEESFIALGEERKNEIRRRKQKKQSALSSFRSEPNNSNFNENENIVYEELLEEEL